MIGLTARCQSIWLLKIVLQETAHLYAGLLASEVQKYLAETYVFNPAN